ncbi:MAG: hypothetical protein HUU35_12665, partial [Armatimonadetes bacterium]|nr:hypothetical protein [Armatimonadota bacterium]
YDDANRLLRRIDGRDQVTDYTYNDPGGRLTAVSYPATPSQNLTFGYDALGRRTAMTDAEGSHTYTYDDGGTLLSQTVTYNGLAAKTVSYGYHPNGSRASLTHPGDSLTYGYDAAGRLTSLDYGLGTASWDYLANGLLARQTLPNGAVTDSACDGANRLRELLNKDPSGDVLAAYGETRFLPTGDLASWTAAISGQATQSGTTGYVYDLQPALTEVGSIAGGMGLYGLATRLAQQVSATAVVQALAALLAALGECLATDALSGRV